MEHHSIPSALNTPQQPVSPHGEPAGTEVDLNKVLQQVFSAVQHILGPHHIIIRCDRLPVLHGHQQHFDKLFTCIMQLIVSEPLAGCRQFLYVKCEEEETDTDILTVSIPSKTFIIQFHSNIALDAYWQTVHQPVLSDCERIAKTYGGSLAYTQLNSGSLFTLRLAGKPL